MPFEVHLTRQHLTTITITSLVIAVSFFNFIATVLLSETLLATYFTNFDAKFVHVLYHFGYHISMLAGGIIIGLIGDKWGRKSALLLSLFGVNLSTLLLSAIPTLPMPAELIALSILCCKISLGLFLGGILPSIWTLVSEQLPARRIGTGLSLIMASCIMSVFAFYFFNNMLNNLLSYLEMKQIGWRLLLNIGGSLGVFILFVARQYLTESSVFLRLKSTKQNPPEQAVSNCQTTLTQALSTNWLIASIVSVVIVSLLVFVPTLLLPLVELNFTLSLFSSRFGSMLTIVFMAVGCVFFGVLSDFVNRTRLLIMAGIALLIQSAIFVLYMQNDGALVLLFLVLSGFLSGFISVLSVVLSRLFPHQNRLTAIAIMFNLIFATLGGILPFLLGYLSYYTGSTPMLYMVLIGLLTIFIGFYVQSLPVCDESIQDHTLDKTPS